MKKNIFVVSAFTKNGTGGNLAGVGLDSCNLSESDRLFIARELGFSETAFIIPSHNVHYEVRYYTPESEVDLCGHATIATFSCLAQKISLEPGTYSIKTRAGILQVLIEEDKKVYLQQTEPRYLDIVDSEEIIDSLMISKDSLMSELPIQIVSTGLKDIMIPIRNYKDLQSIQPDFEKIKQVSRKYDTVGYHLFTLEPVHQEAIAHCRNFAPLYGIKEESATGTSNAALAAYLFQYKKIKPNERNLKFEQGYGMGEPSEILVRLDTNKDSITNIMVGGYASIIEEREVDLHKS